MQNLHVGTCIDKHVLLEQIAILDSLVFLQVGEAFPLHARHI